MSNLLTPDVLGAVSSLTNYNGNLDKIENSIGAQGYFVVSGLVPSAGTGLSVNVTAGTALVAGLVTVSAGFSIGGLTPSTVNHLYLNQNGTGTSNTTGTQPALTTKLGTATTSGVAVTAVNVLRSSGRQSLVRPENQVPGDPGSPGSLDYGDWNATAGDGFTFFGTIPSGALPTGGTLLAQTTKTTNYTALSTDYFLFCDATAGNITITLPTAVGLAGKAYAIKKIDASANTVTIDANGAQTIDGALTIVIGVQYTSYSIVSNNANWWIW